MAMTKSQVVAALAAQCGVSKQQAGQFFDELAVLAYQEAKNTFVVPGLGKLVLKARAARMGRNPATGAQIQIPARQVVKFRVAKAVKDSILSQK